MRVEALGPKRETQLPTSTAESMGLPVMPGFSGLMADSARTISLVRPDIHPAQRLVGKISSLAAKLAGRFTKVMLNSIGTVTKEPEKVVYQSRRRPRCSHGYRFDDASRVCDCGKFRADSTNNLFKPPPRRSGLTIKPQRII